MKTQKRLLKKVGQFFCLAVLAIGIQSCDTDIPLEDREPPKFSFQITGDGFNHIFNQDTDFDNIQLNLRKDATYTFTISGSDTGGLRSLRWTIKGNDQIVLQDPIISPWVFRNSILMDVIQWYGDPANPVSGSFLTGNMKVAGDLGANLFRFTLSDYGGESGRPNYFFADLKISIGNHTTEIISL